MRLRAFVLFSALTALVLLTAGTAAAEMPQINTPASISGNAVVGEQLTAHNGTWLYSDGTSCHEECVLTYQWQRCDASGNGCADISGATGRFYAVQAADAGSRLRATEFNTKHDCGAPNYQEGTQECHDVTRSAPSVLTAAVPGTAPTGPTTPTTPTTPTAPTAPAVPAPQAPLAPAVTAGPEVKGIAMVDEILTATKGTWSGSPKLSLEWQHCDAQGANCSGTGVTTDTYTVIPFDIGKTIRVQITASNSVAARTATSAVTALISELKPTEEKTWVPASKVTPPHRLLIEQVTTKPTRFAKRGPATVSLRVTDDRGFKIQGALVRAVVLPAASLVAPAETTTDEEGAVTLAFAPGPKLNLKKKGTVTIAINARRPGDKLSSPRAATARVTITVAGTKTKRFSGR